MIRTILGDISENQLGLCDFHEHFYRTYGPELNISSDFYLNDDVIVKTEIDECLNFGQCSFVCMDPIGCGRDLNKMLTLATAFKDKASFIMCTGFHKGQLYDSNFHWSQKLPFDKVVELLTLEITEGIDRNNYCCPIINRSINKAGLIKAGISYKTITDFEVNSLKLAANVQKNTNAPISIHTEYGSMCAEAIKILEKEGCDLTKVVFCHMHRNLDINNFKMLMNLGVNLCFDGLDRPSALNEEKLKEVILELVKDGYKEQVLLSMDAGRKQYHRIQVADNIYTKGITSVFSFFEDDRIKNQILHDNPVRILSAF